MEMGTVAENWGAFVPLIMFILTIGSFLWMARSDYRHLDAKIEAIQAEMKDFHGRLVRQDAEFKCFMRKEEEKRTTILMGRSN